MRESLQDVVCTLDAEPDCPAVFGNANQLRQVFLNLFLNAVQAMPTGGLLSVSVRSMDGDRVCVEVADGGTGIPMEDLPHIFDPFFTTKPRGKGTGLGLAMVHAIVKKHGGEIHVESIQAKGTTFQVCLPAAGSQKER